MSTRGSDRPGRCEERIFLGDECFLSLVERLASQPSPLIRIRRSAKRWPAWRAVSTAAGRAVLAGKKDAIRLRAIDRWIGGVHLQGREAEWRWNGETMRLERHAAVASI